MNNKSKLLAGCLALLLVLSMGYALFSEQITINGAATAKGSFSIGGTCIKGIEDELWDLYGLTTEEFSEGGYKEEYCSIDGNSVDFGATLEYPGASRYFTIVLTNNGSIPAKINENSDITDNVIVCLDDGSCTDFNKETSNAQNKFMKKYYMEYFFAGFKTSSNQYVAGDSAEEFIDEDTGDYIIESGESIVYLVKVFWHKSNPAYAISENYGDFTATTIMNFNFTQVVE